MKYILGTVLTLILGYFSVNIKPLDEVVKSRKAFDAKSYATQFLEKTLVAEYPNAISIKSLVAQINSDKNKTFDQYAHGNAIGNIKYFLVKGKGKVTKVQDDQIIIQDSTINYAIETEYIYGAAIRDASGAFDMKEFTNFGEINSLTSEINSSIRKNVVQKLKKEVKEGTTIEFIGALELNQQYPHLDNIKVEPIQVKIL
jgi:predicted lipoprotein